MWDVLLVPYLALRERQGKAALTLAQKREVLIANTLVERSLAIAKLILESNGEIVIENPCDRGDQLSSDYKLRDLFQSEYADHSPLW